MKALQVTINKPMETRLCADQREWHADAHNTIWISAETIWNNNNVKHGSWLLAQRFWNNVLTNPDGWAEGAHIQVHNARTDGSVVYQFSHVSYAGAQDQTLVYRGMYNPSLKLLVFRDGATMRNYWAAQVAAPDPESIAMAVASARDIHANYGGPSPLLQHLINRPR